MPAGSMSMRSAWPESVDAGVADRLQVGARLRVARCARPSARSVPSATIVAGQAREARPPDRLDIRRQRRFGESTLCQSPAGIASPPARRIEPRSEKRCRISWNSVPRSAAPGSRSSGSSGDSAEDAPRIDRIGIAPQRLDLGDREMLRPRVERRLRLRALGELSPAAGVEARAQASSRRRARACSPVCPARQRSAAAAASATARPAHRRRAPRASARPASMPIAI